MTNYKSGLQKNISAIFEDAPALNQDGSIASPDSSNTADEKTHQQIQNNIKIQSENPQASEQGTVVSNCPPKQTIGTTTPLGNSLALKLANEQNPDAKKMKITPGPNPPTRNTPKKQTDAVRADTRRALPFKSVLEKAKKRFFAPKPGLSTQRQVVTALFIPILAIALIAILKVFALPATQKAQAETPDISPSIKAADGINWQLPQPYPVDLRDPMTFAQDIKITTEKNEFVINGILHSQDKPTVIIGNRIFHVGDRIGEAVITKIDIHGVEFESSDRKWTQHYDTKNEIAEINSLGKEVK